MRLEASDITLGLSESFQVKSLEAKPKKLPKWQFVGENNGKFDFEEFGITVRRNSQGLVEAVTTSADVSSDFFKRMEYEVEAGRKEVPILYDGIYEIMVDPNLPEVIEVDKLGPAGVTFNEIPEGGQVDFASITSTGYTLKQKHYGVGLSYTEDMFRYNQTWLFPGLERDFGAAYNALLNHVHLYPIINYSYDSSNTTDGSSLTTFRADDPLPKKYRLALQQAIADGFDDDDNPKYGPYWILCSTRDAMIMSQGLNSMNVIFNDANTSTSAATIPLIGVGTIAGIIAYNGWAGNMGKENKSYTGVSDGTAYLISTRQSRYDWQSKFNHDLRRQSDGGDITRFIVENVVWDVRFGVFANPARSAQKITLPTSASGAT